MKIQPFRGFQYNLMMICDSGLRFWTTLYDQCTICNVFLQKIQHLILGRAEHIHTINMSEDAIWVEPPTPGYAVDYQRYLFSVYLFFGLCRFNCITSKFFTLCCSYYHYNFYYQRRLFFSVYLTDCIHQFATTFWQSEVFNTCVCMVFCLI